MIRTKFNYGWLSVLVLFSVAISSQYLQADTKALWKLDYSPYTGLNNRCLVDPSNDMKTVIQGQQIQPPRTPPALPTGMTGAWSPLPPNPDTSSDLLDSTESTNTVFYGHGILFSSTGIVSTINSATSSFTIEGWHNRANWYVPQIGAFTPLFSLGNSDGWRFSLYNQNDTNNLYFLISDYRSPNNLSKVFPIPAPKAELYQKWCHYALVYDHEGGDGVGTWEFFLNSESHGIVTNNSNQAAPGPATGFYLGGDGYNSHYFNAGGYGYWRISDQALSPNEFLDAGTATFEEGPETLAFFRLDSKSDGSLDLSNRVANAYHLQASGGSSDKLVLTNAEQAVSSVPFPDTSDHFLGDRTANQGSVTFRRSDGGKDSYLYCSDGLGYQLGTNTAWTIETWIKFTALGSRQIIFDAKANIGTGAGWMFMNYSGMGSRYALWFGSTPSYIAFPESTGGTDETSLNEWHHLALTFDPASGPGYQGAWECFLNGRSLGTIEYSNSYTRVDSSNYFVVGGRNTTYSDSVYGSMDIVRVTRGILETNQFLNAGGYIATTNAIETLAYWKLDSNGSWIDTSSQVDSRYSLNNATNAPVAGSTLRFHRFILNPDTSEEFIGDPSSNTGSILISNRTALTVGNLGNRLELDRAYTVEGWMKWNNMDDRQTQVIAGTKFNTKSGVLLPPIGTANQILYETSSGWLLTLEKNGADVAFHINCTTILTNEYTSGTEVIDADLASFSASTVAGKWNHIALTYKPNMNDAGRWTFYLNGEEAGTADNDTVPFNNHESHQFVLGGQSAGETSFDGYLDCWRVSDGILSIDDLLYVNIPSGTVILVR